MMRISRSGRTSDVFGDELKEKLAKKMPGSDKHIDQRLKEQRKIRSHASEEGTEEVLLESDRKGDKSVGENLTEENLRKKYQGPAEEVEVITEKQLDDAPKKGKYPHRNAKAYERTGDKRQVNALDEEMGKSGDGAKVDRYEKASKPGPKRLLDKDVGKQLDNDKTKIKNAFNLKQQKRASLEKAAGDYLAYRGEDKTYNRKFAEVAVLDSAMAGIMGDASLAERDLTDDERAKITAMKEEKARLLKVAAPKEGPADDTQ